MRSFTTPVIGWPTPARTMLSHYPDAPMLLAHTTEIR